MCSARYEIENSSGSLNTQRFGCDEIEILLDLCEKHEIFRQSQTKGYSLVKAFTPIHEEMLNAGYNRNLSQVIEKFRKLKIRFARAYIAKIEGKPAMSNRFEHYKRFEKMLETADTETFVKNFIKINIKENDKNFYDNSKDDNNSTNILDNKNEYHTIETDHDIIEKDEVLLDDKFLEPSTTSKSFLNNTGSTKNVAPSERTVLLEQLLPNFKKAQLELQQRQKQQFLRQQQQFFRQQKELQQQFLQELKELQQ